MNQPMMELPKYKSHKIVRALSIAAIEIHEDKSATIAPSLTAYAPFRTQAGWAERWKGSEEDKGYYVVYDDGYASWSPTEAFENGYTKLREDHTPISELKAALHANPDYAWTWQCNLACIGIDSVSDMANLAEDEHLTPHQTANRRAAQFMRNAFDLDIRTNERWKEFEAQWMNEAMSSVVIDVISSGMTVVRAQRLMDQVMKTWNPPRWAGKESLEVATQTSVMLTIAYVMGREFIPSELTANQRAAIDSGLVVLQNALDEREAADGEAPTLEHWLEQWESAIEAGQSSISREEAEKRYRKAHGRDHGHPNGEG